MIYEWEISMLRLTLSFDLYDGHIKTITTFQNRINLLKFTVLKMFFFFSYLDQIFENMIMQKAVYKSYHKSKYNKSLKIHSVENICSYLDQIFENINKYKKLCLKIITYRNRIKRLKFTACVHI